MQRIFADDPMPAALRGGVAALGNFDGFHAGHQAVIGEARYRARAKAGPALVVTFDPHPVRLFKPDAPPMLLTTISQRLDLFEQAGMDAAIVLRFDRALARLSPKAFVVDVLAGRLGLSGVVTGEDFTFGQRAAGSADDLAALGEAHGVEAVTVAPVSGIYGRRISSTRIREALGRGEPLEAARMLSRPFTIRGEVVHGEKRGRSIGVPTANIRLGGYVRPSYGVYAVRAALPDGTRLGGVANLGIRPMFNPPEELLESWFFEFDGDLYGQEIDVELIAWLREERKLPDLDALKAQIMEDAKAARTALDAPPAGG